MYDYCDQQFNDLLQRCRISVKNIQKQDRFQDWIKLIAVPERFSAANDYLRRHVEIMKYVLVHVASCQFCLNIVSCCKQCQRHIGIQSFSDLLKRMNKYDVYRLCDNCQK